MMLNASKLLGVGASLAAFAVGGGGQDGLNVLVEHIRTVGPRPWLGLMTASLVPGASAFADRRSQPRSRSTVAPRQAGRAWTAERKPLGRVHAAAA